MPFVLLFVFLFIHQAKASEKFLNVGDVFLVSYPCYLCRAIELEEGMPYSHIAMVAKNKYGQWGMVESLKSGFDWVSWNDFWSRKLTGESNVLHIRHVFNALKIISFQVMEKSYGGTFYDPLFAWGNRDEVGKEKFYCSELLYKIFQKSLGKQFHLVPKKMHFDHAFEFWNSYYLGYSAKVPAGELGLSPADYVKSKDFIVLKKYNISSDGDAHLLRERVRGKVLLP